MTGLVRNTVECGDKGPTGERAPVCCNVKMLFNLAIADQLRVNTFQTPITSFLYGTPFSAHAICKRFGGPGRRSNSEIRDATLPFVGIGKFGELLIR